MHTKNIKFAGQPLKSAEKFLILLHGRGADAEDILSITQYLNVGNYALIAPRAANNTWYPYSFMASRQQNEPWLGSALELVLGIVNDLKTEGVKEEQIYFCGFSQGACLTVEFIARNPARYGGAAAFTGGLIGDKISTEDYRGDLKNMPLFIGTSDPDPHVPVDRVTLSAEILKKMNAQVLLKIYSNLGHTIDQDEFNTANKLIFSE